MRETGDDADWCGWCLRCIRCADQQIQRDVLMVCGDHAGVHVMAAGTVGKPQQLAGGEGWPLRQGRRGWRWWWAEGHGCTPGRGSALAGSQWLQVQSNDE